MKSIALITGTTGFIGFEILKKISNKFDLLCPVVRAESLEKAALQFKDIKNIKIISGDLLNLDLIDNQDDLEYLNGDVTAIHIAAHYDIKANKSEAYQNNILGTMNFLNFLKKISTVHSLHYVSTFAVNMGTNTIYQEEELSGPDREKDNYVWSKNHAEFYIRKHSPYLTRIYRPGIVVASSNEPITKYDGPYLLLKEILNHQKLIKALPIPYMPFSFNPNTILPFITQDYIASMIGDMIVDIKSKTEALRTYHLVGDDLYSAQDFIKATNDYYGLNKKIVPAPGEFIFSDILSRLDIPNQILAYLNNPSGYSNANLAEDYPDRPAFFFKKFEESFFNQTLLQWGEAK